MRNNSGPSILPCGTPDVTGSRLEDLLLIDTHWNLEDRYALNQDHRWPEIPMAPSLCRPESMMWNCVESFANV